MEPARRKSLKCQRDGCCELGPVHNQKFCIKHRCKQRAWNDQMKAKPREFWCERDQCHLLTTTNGKTKYCRECRCYKEYTLERLRGTTQVLTAKEVLSWK